MVRTGLARKLHEKHTSDYCIAYLDILGAQNCMKNDIDDKFLNELNSIYFDAIYPILFEGLNFQNITHFKIFSDNILLAVPIDNDKKNTSRKLTTLINYVGNIYNNALHHGHLIRGSITTGKLFINEKFVYGNALVEAVNMEGKLAIYPRIIVHDKLTSICPQYLEQTADNYWIVKNFLFADCNDYISFKLNLLNMLKKYHKDEKAKQKIMWAITYYNCYYGNPNNYDTIGAEIITDEEIENAIIDSAKGDLECVI